MRRFTLATALFLGLSIVGTAAAAACTTTGFMRDGIDLTAAQIGGTAAGIVNATGCHIGVYMDNTNAGNVSNATIFGATYFGVVVNGDTGTVAADVKDSVFFGVGETPFNGAQHGAAVYYRALGSGSLSGTISGNLVVAYQKGGIVVNGSGAQVDTVGNIVTGLGPVDFIAQNGIQYGFGANGTVTDNDISVNFYTGTVGVGPNPGGQNPPGWEYISAGLLLYQPGDVRHSGNRFSGNQRNVATVP